MKPNVHLPEPESRNEPNFQPITMPIPKRMEPMFIEPMQCKSITALPPNGKWTFEIKFDGFRCIAVKVRQGVTLFSRHKKGLNRRASLGLWMPSLHSIATSFSMENWLHWIRKGDLPFRLFKTTCLGPSGLFLLLRPAKPRWGKLGEFAD